MGACAARVQPATLAIINRFVRRYIEVVILNHGNANSYAKFANGIKNIVEQNNKFLVMRNLRLCLGITFANNINAKSGIT